MIILPIRERNGAVLRGYVIQDWQDYNVAIFGTEEASPRPEGSGQKILLASKFRRAGKPVHYPCVYYRPQWESSQSFRERIILEHPQLTLEQFVGL